jgi:hypothetical protein
MAETEHLAETRGTKETVNASFWCRLGTDRTLGRDLRHSGHRELMFLLRNCVALLLLYHQLVLCTDSDRPYLVAVYLQIVQRLDITT